MEPLFHRLRSAADEFSAGIPVIAWLLGVVGLLWEPAASFRFRMGNRRQAWMALGQSAGGTLAVGRGAVDPDTERPGTYASSTGWAW
jgi:hypothetical protein